MSSFGADQLGTAHVLEPRVAVKWLLDFWNQWATQILVILSLMQQVLLLFFSGIRRRQGCSAKRLFLWLPYQLADSTATYTLGTLAVSSTLHDHRLVAFWVPVLLLHLAGPDNITAYSLEGNKLWKRHLLTLAVPVLWAGYVLYKHLNGSGIMFWLVATLMTTVAAAKMCEKTWALRCANFSMVRGSVEAGMKNRDSRCQLYLEKKPPTGGFREKVVDKEEFLMLRAHAVFPICKSAMVDSAENPGTHVVDLLKYLKENEMGYMWMMMEMELSLMYDILYTKTALVHTLPGYCIRVVSPLAVVTCLLLFQYYAREGLSSADVVITYILLGSAFLMEMTSLLTALWSTWTFSFLCATQWSSLRHEALCLNKWHRLRRMVLTLRRLAFSTRVAQVFMLSRKWSGSLGQYNMLEACTSRPGRLARMMGFNMRRTVGVPEGLKALVEVYIQHMMKRRHVNSLGVVREKWGMEALQRWDEERGVCIDRAFLGAELHEGIIIWHIATDIFLAQKDMNKDNDKHDLVKQVQTLSNYMMFLLVKRPDMLPGLAQNKLYKWTERSLDTEWSKARGNPTTPETNCIDIICHIPASSSGFQPSENLAKALYSNPPKRVLENNRLCDAIHLAKILVRTNNALKLVYEVWADFLIYTANRCSRESHARKLNSGGEFTTIVWLMTEHLYQLAIYPGQ